MANNIELPENLRRLPDRIAILDEHGIAPDVVDGVRRLIESSWDGTMVSSSESTDTNDMRTPLKEAIQKCTTELDAASMAFMVSVPAEMNTMLRGAFDSSLFCQDVVKAFTNLKIFNFDGLSANDYDNIQAAISKNEDSWHSGPNKKHVFVVQQFFKRMVELLESFRKRTGRTLDLAPDNNEILATASSTMTQVNTILDYQNEDPIVGGARWPECANDIPDWAKLFGPDSKENDDEDEEVNEEDDDGPWLTPRMAAKIHHVAIVDADTLLADYGFCPPRLPKIARPFFKRSRKWRLAFRDCYVRIGLRLQKGLPPQPNCTGEEMAFHNIMEQVPDVDDVLYDDENYTNLPEYPNDNDYHLVKDLAVQDEDVLMLFEQNDTGYDSNSDEDEINVDNALGPGSIADFMLGSGGARVRAVNIHPSDWFKAFRKDRFRDHW